MFDLVNEADQIEDLAQKQEEEEVKIEEEKLNNSSDAEGNEENKSQNAEDGANEPEDNKEDEEGGPIIRDEEDFNGDDLKDNIAFVEKMGHKRYITFAEFAKKMSLFNPRTDIEDKIHFYFRIFDVDEDKKIKKDDLHNVMRMLFGKNISEEEMDKLTEKVFLEVLQSSSAEKDYLDADDLQKVLYSTDIEHKCSMHFFQA